MNLIETIYCSQYYELKKSNRDPQKGRLNGTLLSAVMIILAVVGIGLAANKFTGSHWLNGLSSSGFSGKFIGRIVALVLLVVIGGTLSFTYGSRQNYNKMMQRWEQLPVEVLEQTIKTALKIFGIVFGVFLVVIVVVV
ncbi:MAG: hypothetical protein ABJA76_00160 [Mucilaginibacter sp.]